MRNKAKLEKAKIVVSDGGLRLFGTLVEDARFTIGHRVFTSRIIGMEGNVIHTENTDYEIVGPRLTDYELRFVSDANKLEQAFVTQKEG